jgi:hypothetical protein
MGVTRTNGKNSPGHIAQKGGGATDLVDCSVVPDFDENRFMQADALAI